MAFREECVTLQSPGKMLEVDVKPLRQNCGKTGGADRKSMSDGTDDFMRDIRLF